MGKRPVMTPVCYQYQENKTVEKIQKRKLVTRKECWTIKDSGNYRRRDEMHENSRVNLKAL
jgi:hypothetical protein